MEDVYKRQGVTFPYVHASNSAGIIDVRRADYNLVRAGIAIYGPVSYTHLDVYKRQIMTWGWNTVMKRRTGLQ